MPLILLLNSLAAGILYRLGGKAGWNTKYRDVGTALCITAGLALHGLNPWLVLSFGAAWGALTSYKYFLPKPVDYTWLYYALHGAVCSAAAGLYYALAHNAYWSAGIRCVVGGVLVGAWSALCIRLSRVAPWEHWDDIHEGGRGVIICTVAIV